MTKKDDKIEYRNTFYKRDFHFMEDDREFIARTNPAECSLDGIHFTDKGFEFWENGKLVKTYYFSSSDDLLKYCDMGRLCNKICEDTDISIRLNGDTKVFLLLGTRNGKKRITGTDEEKATHIVKDILGENEEGDLERLIDNMPITSSTDRYSGIAKIIDKVVDIPKPVTEVIEKVTWGMKLMRLFGL